MSLFAVHMALATKKETGREVVWYGLKLNEEYQYLTEETMLEMMERELHT